MNRQFVNDLKTQLKVRLDLITKVYEGIETEDHYDAFINMTGTHLEFCNHYLRILKRDIISLRPIKSIRLYNDYKMYAQHTLNIIQNMISEYGTALKDALKDQEDYETTYKRIATEYKISNDLNDARFKELIKNDHKTIVGFGINNTKKRKYTKKNNGDK